MTATKETRFYKEPTRDEIALSAFLAWERDGRPHGADLKYWFEAEQTLRAQRQKQAEAAAAQAAKPWPPQSRASNGKASPPALEKAPLTTEVERSTAVKVARTPKATTPRRPALKKSR